jgi:hypothetical protein
MTCPAGHPRRGTARLLPPETRQSPDGAPTTH